jgi:hypothetical protein
VARTAQPKLGATTEQAIAMAREAVKLRPFFAALPRAHGNTKVDEFNVFWALSCAFYEPLARSLRTIDQLTEIEAVQQDLDVERIAKSTLSDALARFRTPPLEQIVRHLRRRLPQLKQADADLERIVQKIIAMDGSYFTMAGEVAWALKQRNQLGHRGSQVRLDLQLDVRRWTPERFALSGAGQGSETKAQQALLQGDVVYLCDRNYNAFAFLCQVLEAKSHIVLRLKKDVVFRPQRSLPLGEKDWAAGVQADEVGQLGSETGAKGHVAWNHAPPQQPLRLVTIWDPVKQEQVRLVTDLRDLEAWVIGYLYRCRWIIELFFRWLKVTAAMDHLISHSPAGITVQVYVAIIATLWIHIQSGVPVNKYSLFGLGLVARGRAKVEEVLPGIQRRVRERELERQRLKRKKAAQNQAA